MHFRKGLLRRELVQDIDYKRHRDHSTHTVNNFLLGWLIFSNSDLVCSELELAFKKRFDRSWPLYLAFGNTWPLVSLLHDIGYLFEGTLSATTTEAQNERIKRGSNVVDDYFKHIFWSKNGVSSVENRAILIKLSNLPTYKFSYSTMGEVADSLRSVGSLERLRNTIYQELKSSKNPDVKTLKKEHGLPFDAFDIWKKNYETHGQYTMVERVSNMEKLFESLIFEGMPKNGIRIIDHGVASGLLLLKVLTNFYQLYFGLPESEPANDKEKVVWKWFKKERIPNGVYYRAWFWWKGIVWATCATAIHNILQLNTPSHDPQYNMKPLSIKEDPLAYLGILVDVIEEWDRYTIHRDSMFTSLLPVQSIDVKIKIDNEIVKIDYGDQKRNDKVIISLKQSLKNWNKVVKIGKI